MKQPKLNPLDQAIQARMAVYNKIEGYPGILSDDELRYAHIFIATKIEGLHVASQLIIKSFLPAINKSIAETQVHLNKSIYRTAIKDSVIENWQTLKDDTIRLGYVLFFHKYENFVKDYVNYVEQRSSEYTKETGKTYLQYCKEKFNFTPFDWWKFPAIHKVNFISNCTKHHDGKCKLDNPKHTKPNIFAQLQETDIIKPSLANYKDDTTNLINSIANCLVPILENILMYRAYESLTSSFDSLILSYKSALASNEVARKETYIENGVPTLLLTGDDLREYENRAKDNENEKQQHTNTAQGYKDKMKACENTVHLAIQSFQTE